MSTYRVFEATANFTDNIIDPDADVVGSELSAEAKLSTEVKQNSVKDYNLLENKPSIEEVILIGNKTFRELGLRSATNLEIETILQS